MTKNAAKSESDSRSFAAFAVAAPGLESLACFELRRLGIHNPRAEFGGVAFQTTYSDIEKANLWSRISERILLRVSEFHASSFGELEAGARRIAWKKWILPGTRVAVSAASHASEIYHAGAAAQRVMEAIDAVVGGIQPVTLREAGELEEISDEQAHRNGAAFGDEIFSRDSNDPAYGESIESAAGDIGLGAVQRVYVRLERDVCTVSIDSSGERLHRRGYRQSIKAAPLRETLAAAVALCGGVQNLVPALALKNGADGSGKFGTHRWMMDPMCGSGTIPIETALLICGAAPGLNRRFAFENWPVHDRNRWILEKKKAESSRIQPPPGFRIEGSDIDSSALEAARQNAERAGLPKDLIQWRLRSADSLPQMRERGIIITNPPYGHRLGDPASLRTLFQKMGKSFISACAPGSSLAVLLPADGFAFEKCFGFPMNCRTKFKNGGIPVGLWIGTAVS